ncbi:gram-negative bacterial tonB protein [Ferrovum sp. JA12]|uniref:energy transducer TonB n=1 Tax=Ferrovum sp. JA12 TaxID=1356299 RepID=UPI000702EA22|nr:TonB family protein [Ferrovum sp. JA12]KRH79454.1 gram-negative bacterial tonB protein [Ferrovum sp. JA12]
MVKKTTFLWVLLLSLVIHICILWFFLSQYPLPQINTLPFSDTQAPVNLTWFSENLVPPKEPNIQPSLASKDITRFKKKDIVLPVVGLKKSPINDHKDLITQSLDMAKHLEAERVGTKRIINSINNQYAVIQQYENDFRGKVERIGSVNYPAPVNGNPLSGNVRVSVVIDSNGHIQELLVLRSSGVIALDQAAINIIRLCDPFPPFSETMKAITDEVRITRTFVFRQTDESVISH